MAPKSYISAREAKESLAIIDNQPYFPALVVDISDEESIKKVALQVLVTGSCKKNGEKDNETLTDVDASGLTLSVVSGGITNNLYRVCGLKEYFQKSEGNFDHDSVLVRVFGAEGMIDRDIENATYAALSNSGVAPGYYGRFSNGRLEEWLGDTMRPLETKEMSSPNILPSVAVELAKVHTQFELPKHLHEFHHPTKACLFEQLNSWMKQSLESKFKTQNDTDRAAALELPKVVSELHWLQHDIVESKTDQFNDLAFCHNDLLAANILFNDKTNEIRFIDFEYGGVNYTLFDIANHFNEFAGGPDTNGVTDYNQFPTIGQQKQFIATYLTKIMQIKHSQNSNNCANEEMEPTEKQIEDTFDQVTVFVMINHLYWGLWAVNQAATEGCDDFDYLEFGKNRIERYYHDKKEFDTAK